MNTRSKHLSGVLATMLSALLYSTLPVLSNLSYEAGNNAETFNFYKSAWAIPFLLLIVIARKQSVFLPFRMTCFVFLAGILGKGVASLFLFLSYNYIPGGIATTLHFMYPLFAALLGWIFFRMKLPAYKWLALLTATASVALFVDTKAGMGSMTGVVCAVASGVVYALYILTVDKSGISGLDPFVFALYLSVSGAVFSLAYGMATGTMIHNLPVMANVYAAAAAVVTSVIAAACFQLGIRYLGGTSAAFFSLLEPVCSCILGAVFLKESIGIRVIVGILLILGSEVVMIFLDNKRENMKSEEIS